MLGVVGTRKRGFYDELLHDKLPRLADILTIILIFESISTPIFRRHRSSQRPRSSGFRQFVPRRLRSSGQSEAAPPCMNTTSANISLLIYLCGYALYSFAYMLSVSTSRTPCPSSSIPLLCFSITFPRP